MGSDNDYGVASWNGFAKFSFLNQSDPNSGVGVTSLNELARLYVRNSTTGYLAQWALGWGTEVEGWWQSKLTSHFKNQREETAFTLMLLHTQP